MSLFLSIGGEIYPPDSENDITGKKGRNMKLLSLGAQKRSMKRCLDHKRGILNGVLLSNAVERVSTPKFDAV